MSDNLKWLHADVQQNRELLEKEDSQLARRNYLRSLVALYELTLSNLRERTAKLLVDKFEFDGQWNLHEIIPLLDDIATLSDNGKLKLNPNRLPFLSLVAYMLKTYAKLIDYPENVLSDNRWQAFRQTITIRHRITHPKLYSDIDITNDELQLIDEGRNWWNDTLNELWKTHSKKVVDGYNQPRVIPQSFGGS